jgi:hypothetical protein
MQYLISEYIDAIRNDEDNFGELSYFRSIFDNDGLPVMSRGTFSVSFKMTDDKNTFC